MRRTRREGTRARGCERRACRGWRHAGPAPRARRGLATALGDTPTVGLGGIALGGGIGFLVRKNGLAIDDLLAAEVATADGEFLEVDKETHADLFWALRGGGGSFGVATRQELS